MDPIHREEVWKVIEKMKQDRVIILTTHDMTEANVLSDLIGVMNHGQLTCLGTAVDLKREYGSGYYLNVITESPDLVESRLLEALPEATKLTQTHGNLTFNIPEDGIEHIKAVLIALEGEHLLKEWGLSHTSKSLNFTQLTPNSVRRAIFVHDWPYLTFRHELLALYF